MVKKLKQMADKKSASAAGLLDSQFASTVKDSAQQIWLAGLGAFSKAQEEGGKVFEALVKEGVTLQKKTQSVAEEKMGEVAGKMSGMAGDVTAKAGQHWDKLESIFEERTARALGKLGVPSAKDVASLNQRIDELTAQIAKMSRAPASKTAAKTAAKTGAAKPASKAATKRSPARKTS
jgi:poly(hydroxyalkanoate) granule-associated protein